MRPPQGSVQLLIRGEVAALPLKGVIDFAAERVRLDKEMQKAEADIKRVDQKLGNPKFVANAPEEIVEGEREKREEAEARRGKIVEALERLQSARCDSTSDCAAAAPCLARDGMAHRTRGGSNGGRSTQCRNPESTPTSAGATRKGGSVDDWMKICDDNIAFGSLAQGAAPRAQIPDRPTAAATR